MKGELEKQIMLLMGTISLVPPKTPMEMRNKISDILGNVIEIIGKARKELPTWEEFCAHPELYLEKELKFESELRKYDLTQPSRLIWRYAFFISDKIKKCFETDFT